jgi:coenzyme Q-binding protein COQ10
MQKIENSKFLPYTITQLQTLILDIDAYSEFLPFCFSSKVVNLDANGVITADVQLRFKSFSHSYRSIVTCASSPSQVTIETKAIPNSAIGKLNHRWNLSSMENGTLIETSLELELKSALLNKMLDVLLTDTERKIISAFYKRARYIYDAQI